MVSSASVTKLEGVYVPLLLSYEHFPPQPPMGAQDERSVNLMMRQQYLGFCASIQGRSGHFSTLRGQVKQ